MGEEAKCWNTALRREESGLIPVWFSSTWRSEPGEMDGLVKRLEMREKSVVEKLGLGGGGFGFELGFGFEFGLGWFGGSDGQWMSGFPGWDSHEEEEEEENGIGLSFRVDDRNERRENRERRE